MKRCARDASFSGDTKITLENEPIQELQNDEVYNQAITDFNSYYKEILPTQQEYYEMFTKRMNKYVSEGEK